MGHPVTGLSIHGPLRSPCCPTAPHGTPRHGGLRTRPLQGWRQGARGQPLRRRSGVSDSSLTPPIKPF